MGTGLFMFMAFSPVGCQKLRILVSKLPGESSRFERHCTPDPMIPADQGRVYGSWPSIDHHSMTITVGWKPPSSRTWRFAEADGCAVGRRLRCELGPVGLRQRDGRGDQQHVGPDREQPDGLAE